MTKSGAKALKTDTKTGTVWVSEAYAAATAADGSAAATTNVYEEELGNTTIVSVLIGDHRAEKDSRGDYIVCALVFFCLSEHTHSDTCV